MRIQDIETGIKFNNFYLLFVKNYVTISFEAILENELK